MFSALSSLGSQKAEAIPRCSAGSSGYLGLLLVGYQLRSPHIDLNNLTRCLKTICGINSISVGFCPASLAVALLIFFLFCPQLDCWSSQGFYVLNAIGAGDTKTNYILSFFQRAYGTVMQDCPKDAGRTPWAMVKTQRVIICTWHPKKGPRNWIIRIKVRFYRRGTQGSQRQSMQERQHKELGRCLNTLAGWGTMNSSRGLGHWLQSMVLWVIELGWKGR